MIYDLGMSRLPVLATLAPTGCNVAAESTLSLACLQIQGGYAVGDPPTSSCQTTGPLTAAP